VNALEIVINENRPSKFASSEMFRDS